MPPALLQYPDVTPALLTKFGPQLQVTRYQEPKSAGSSSFLLGKTIVYNGMKLGNRPMWLNFLALVPSTVLTVLLIAVPFLRFYDQTDFEFLGFIAHPRIWSNRCTVAALLATLANFGVEWNRRNRETDRLAREAQRRIEEEQRKIEEEQRKIEEEQRREKEEQRRIEEEQRRVAQEREARIREEDARKREDRRREEDEARRVAQEREARNREAEARERQISRTRIETRCRIAEIQFQLDRSETHRRNLREMLALLREYGELF